MRVEKARRLRLVAVVAAALAPAPAQAQGIFFPSRPAQPAQDPFRNPFESERRSPGRAPESAPQRERPRPAAPPRIAGEDAFIGTDAMLNGVTGRLRLERTARDQYGVRLKLDGTMVSSPATACAVELGAAEPVPATSLGRPAGLPRYKVEAPSCPIVFDIVGDAAIVSAPEPDCVFEVADCRVKPRGVWGPEGRGLGPRTRQIERDRGRADTEMRETFRQLLARMKGPDVKAMAAEQASFSSTRDVTCRTYVAENAHGYCASKLTEARVAAIRAQLANAPPPEPRRAR